MKKLLTLAMLFGLSLVLVACGGSKSSESAPAEEAPATEEAAPAAEGSGAKE